MLKGEGWNSRSVHNPAKLSKCIFFCCARKGLPLYRWDGGWLSPSAVLAPPRLAQMNPEPASGLARNWDVRLLEAVAKEVPGPKLLSSLRDCLLFLWGALPFFWSLDQTQGATFPCGPGEGSEKLIGIVHPQVMPTVPRPCCCRSALCNLCVRRE